MIYILLNSIALDPNRWTAAKIPYIGLLDLIESVAEAGFKYVEVWQQQVLLEDLEAIKAIKETAKDVPSTILTGKRETNGS
ncbi:hypothetical protein ACFL5M_03840 [Candidatus Neomarinimicrobiota bacterium]